MNLGETLEFLLKGAVIGFAIAAPVGPIGVLCIRRTFAEGRASGMATGLGAATADAFYGAVAGFGLTAVSGLLLGYQQALRLLGGLFLCALGVKTFVARPDAVSARMEGRGLAQSYASAIFLTLTNPATILSFVAVFAGAGLGQTRYGAADATALVGGVFFGSTAWWLVLSGFIDKWRRRYPEFGSLAPGFIGSAVVTGVTLGVAGERLRRVNQVSGAVLVVFGMLALWSTWPGHESRQRAARGGPAPVEFPAGTVRAPPPVAAPGMPPAPAGSAATVKERPDETSRDHIGRTRLGLGLEAKIDGQEEQAREHFAAAVAALSQAIAQAGDRPDPWTLLAMAQARLELDQPVEATGWADRALQQLRLGDTDEFQNFRAATLIMNVGIVYFRAGQRDVGIAYMDQAISLAPTEFDRADLADLKQETIGGG